VRAVSNAPQADDVFSHLAAMDGTTAAKLVQYIALMRSRDCDF
jgi:hypothetical protein